MTNTSEILSINEERLKELFTHFDPVTGEGSLIERFPFYTHRLAREHPDKWENPVHYIPNTLKKEYGGMKSLEEESGSQFQYAIMKFEVDRVKHDFEYWAYRCVKIKPKAGGEHIPFKLNGPQRRVIKRPGDHEGE